MTRGTFQDLYGCCVVIARLLVGDLGLYPSDHGQFCGHLESEMGRTAFGGDASHEGKWSKIPSRTSSGTLRSERMREKQI